MEKLTLKEIAGYLPFELKVKSGNFTTRTLVIESNNYSFEPERISLTNLLNGIGHETLLYPLSMLTQEIEHNGVDMIVSEYLNENSEKYYLPSDWDSTLFIQKENIKSVPFAVIELLQELHFDIHGLIERGLAIDKSTLKP